MKPSIQFTRRKDGVRIAYSRFGKGANLICPAGWVTNQAYFFEDPVAVKFWSPLAKKFTIIIYDKHGCGQSDRDRTDFTLEAEILDLETIIRHLELDRYSLLCISMAGALAIAYADRYPQEIDRLILYGAFAKGQQLAPPEVQSAIVSLVQASWGLGSKALADIFIPGTSSEARRAFAKFQRDCASAEVAANLLKLTYDLDVTDLLPKVQAPTLVLHRDQDKTIPVHHGQLLAREIASARFRVMTGNLHFPWMGNADAVIEEIIDYFHDGVSKKHPVMDGIAPDLELETVEQTTIVFTDIEASTDLVTQIGDTEARDLFREHDRIVRLQLKKFDGRELQNLGDGFMLSFPSATSAIQCACSIQMAISQSLPRIMLKIGINTGEVIRREGKHPFGQAVVIAARIVEKCKGQQIIISDVSRQLAAGSTFSFIEIGKSKLKGFDERIKLFEVDWAH
jgi:class 3 adenylate cyclase